MKLFKALGVDQLWLNHYGRTPFPLPNRNKTTITHLSNHIYNDEDDSAFGGKSDDGGDNGSNDDVEEVPRSQRDDRWAPEGPRAGTLGIAATSSGTMSPSMFQTVLDHFDQLHVQNQEILCNKQNMAHLVHYTYKQHHWPYPPPDW